MATLKARQQRFVEEYLKDLNASAAYKRAGYKANNSAARVNASKLLTNPNIQAAIDAARKVALEEIRVTRRWILQRLQGEAQRTGEGSSHSARVQAVKILATIKGMMVSKVEVRADSEVRHTYDLSDPEIESRIAELEKRAGGIPGLAGRAGSTPSAN